jgi:hypothetical protein
MIESLYTKYFQKSKCFLFPLLGIKKSSNFIPLGTYIGIDKLIDSDEMKLICEYENITDDKFKLFETDNLLSNPLFEKSIPLKNTTLYIFNLDIYENDWFNFIMGKYSKLSNISKKAIKDYYGEKSKEYKYVDTYLYPQNHYSIYSKLLNVDIDVLKTSGELCTSCDLDKETIKIPVEELELLLKTS